MIFLRNTMKRFIICMHTIIRACITRADDLHLLPGQGIIDFTSILKAAGLQGYNRTMTIEVDPEHAEPGRQYIQQLWDAVNPPERIAI